MQYFVEVRATQQRTGRPVLVPLSEVQKYTGYRSVFCYGPELAERIRQTGSTKDLRGESVYSDTLFLDFDNSDGASTIAYLKEQGIAFERYTSGSRSVHLHVPIVPIEGADVPARHKAWVKQYAADADVSFYHPAGVYRLDRTFHAKTGKPKQLLESVAGKLLELPKLSTNQRPTVVVTDGGTPEQFYIHLCTRKGIGGRRPHMFVLAAAGFEAGMDYEQVLDATRWWNAVMCDEPHDDQAVVTQINGALHFIGRKYGKEAG